MKALLLMAFYSVRSERMLCEQIAYNMLFRWFLDMSMTEDVFDPTVFTKNRERLLADDVAAQFFTRVVDLARDRKLLSSEHFSVDGTMIEAWGSAKSFQPKDRPAADTNGFADFRDTKRSNDTHASTTDPDSRLWRKGRGREAKLAYMGHALMENRHGLVVDFDVTPADGHAERDAAVSMVDRERERRDTKKRKAKRKAARRQRKAAKGRRFTVGADRGYDAKEFIARMRQRGVTPHIAQQITRQRGSGIDGRTTRHRGYRASYTARLRIEKIFGWIKSYGGCRRSRFRGLRKTRFAVLMSVAAYNLIRIAKLNGTADEAKA